MQGVRISQILKSEGKLAQDNVIGIALRFVLWDIIKNVINLVYLTN